MLEYYCEWSGKMILIRGRPDTPEYKDIYLVRYYLFPQGSKWQVYIHRFLRSDSDVPHDHPFDFASYILKGGYQEQITFREDPRNAFWVSRMETHKAGDLLLRQGNHAHKVIIDGKYDWNERKNAPLTLILRGPRYRDWGFLPAAGGSLNQSRCVRDWVKYDEYLGVDLGLIDKESV